MPKNIVLLSDGTGNSAARLFKTNVWRIYEALSLGDPRVQVACYDDGVGTSSFLPFALLGSAFGVGLRRNVLRLYRFLCEHYEPGDYIYLFGFSRGAFTVRVLVGLISQEGVLRMRPHPDDPDRKAIPDAGELQRLSRWAYRTFRYQFNQTGGLVRIIRQARDLLLRFRDRLFGRPPYEDAPRDKVAEIAFVGVWDTVDAYGLAIDELTNGVDQWVWPLSIPNQEPPTIVRKACHALSLDDERHTFHPLLWDESQERQDCIHTNEERVTQVWFAGAHANVGGGYPNDALSYVSLDWMAREAKKQGIDIAHDLLGPITAKLDPFGRIYDARRGLGASYRYNPRHIRLLTNGQVHEGRLLGAPLASPTVVIDRPKIHETVFERIVSAPDGYAPFILPERYAVVTRDGQILDGPANPFETAEQSRWRSHAQEAAWDMVWYRRVVYFLSISAVILMVLRPFREFAGQVIAVAERGGVARVIAAAGTVLPSVASPWVDYYSGTPGELVVGILVILGLMTIGKRLQGAACARMRAVWRAIGGGGIPAGAPPAPSRLTRLRNHDAYQFGFALLRRQVLPTLFGAAALLWLAGVANRVGFEAASAAGLLCHGSSAPSSLQAGAAPVKVAFDVSEFCRPSGYLLEAGAKYRLTPAVSVQSASQLSLQQRVVFSAYVPFRRIWFAKWGLPVARVGSTGLDYHPLRESPIDLSPRSSGELMLFTNDTITPVALHMERPYFGLGWSESYRDNRGQVVVTIQKLEEPPSRRVAGTAAAF